MPAVSPDLVRLRSERGSFSLPEILIGSALLVGIFAATVFVIPGALRQSSASQDRTFGILEIRSAAERMTRELRTASSFTISASQVTFNTPSSTVRFSCSGASGSASCARSEAALGQEPVGSETLVSGLSSSSVFCVRTANASRQYVEVNLLAPPATGREPVEVGAAATLRNTSAAAGVTPECS